MLILFTLFFLLQIAHAAVPDHASPKLANTYLKWDITEQDAKELARWDVLVLDMELQARDPALLKKIREWNPDIVMLVYITPQEIRKDAADGFSIMRKKLVAGIPDDWYLYDASGNRLSWWQGTWLLNVSDKAPMKNGDRLQQYMARFVADELLSTGLWDGVFYDNAWDNITYFAGTAVDYDRNGVVDTSLDSTWRSGMIEIYTNTRARAGNDILLVGNNDNGAYLNELNGKMIEGFPNSGWTHAMDRLRLWKNEHLTPSVNIVNANTGNTGNMESYQKMRFGLTSSLLEDAYYSFDFGDTDHGQLWWYDEYDVGLGSANGNASSLSKTSTYAPDVWRRDFANGIAIVNSTNETKTVDLGGEFEKIHGLQDVVMNDGSIISRLRLGGADGTILLKSFDTLSGLLFPNGAFARFFHASGNRARNGFFSFDDAYAGGNQVAHIDLDANGKNDIVLVTGNRIRAWRDDGQPYMNVYPYGVAYAGLLNVAIGDLNGDKIMEIYVAPSAGHAGPIRAYSRHGFLMRNDWYPFGGNYAGGYALGMGNIDGAYTNELIVGTGKGVEPMVSVYNRYFGLVHRFPAFESSFRGGISVAGGDVDGDGIDDIIVGAGPGKKPVVKLFSGNGTEKGSFTAYDTAGNPGAIVSSQDVDFDGKDDVIVFGENGF